MANFDSSTLLSAAAATGAWIYFAGGRGQWNTSGTFDGATATLQYASVSSPSAGQVQSLGSDAAVTEPSAKRFELAPGYLRVAIAGGSSPVISSSFQHF